MLDDNKNDTKCTQLESTKLDVERSKREDIQIKCPKCKKQLNNCDHHMMGIDKKCFDCDVNWTHRHGFKGYPMSNGNV
jgi:hypothetical protein